MKLIFCAVFFVVVSGGCATPPPVTQPPPPPIPSEIPIFGLNCQRKDGSNERLATIKQGSIKREKGVTEGRVLKAVISSVLRGIGYDECTGKWGEF